jgi:O-methyltransferase involved in polyketide biosynthesis
MNTTQDAKKRDYSAISPSAKSLVLLKGITNIPYARQTAEAFSAPATYHIDLNNNDPAFWKRVVHFEIRYWSVDQLLSSIAVQNILELSSGYSFRGLEMISRKEVHYIDSDLPEVINRKKELLLDLKQDVPANLGTLNTIPLNALDTQQFMNVVDSFPEGPIIIVNEGLLMYLDTGEKEKLCGIIHGVLKQRGGYWITADVYVKSTLARLNEHNDDSLADLVEAQRIEENMFESFDAAEVFFKKAGFAVVKEAIVDLSLISSIPYLLKNATEAELTEMKSSTKKIQATWLLKVESSS